MTGLDFGGQKSRYVVASWRRHPHGRCASKSHLLVSNYGIILGVCRLQLPGCTRCEE